MISFESEEIKFGDSAELLVNGESGDWCGGEGGQILLNANEIGFNQNDNNCKLSAIGGNANNQKYKWKARDGKIKIIVNHTDNMKHLKNICEPAPIIL